jgi:hypothetical protein
LTRGRRYLEIASSCSGIAWKAKHCIQILQQLIILTKRYKHSSQLCPNLPIRLIQRLLPLPYTFVPFSQHRHTLELLFADLLDMYFVRTLTSQLCPVRGTKRIAYVCESESPELGIEVGQMSVLTDAFCAVHLDCPINHSECHGRYGKLKGSA